MHVYVRVYIQIYSRLVGKHLAGCSPGSALPLLMVSPSCSPQGAPLLSHGRSQMSLQADLRPELWARVSSCHLGIFHPPDHTSPRPVQRRGACSSAGVRFGVPSTTDPTVLPREGDYHLGLAVYVRCHCWNLPLESRTGRGEEGGDAGHCLGVRGPMGREEQHRLWRGKSVDCVLGIFGWRCLRDMRAGDRPGGPEERLGRGVCLKPSGKTVIKAGDVRALV